MLSAVRDEAVQAIQAARRVSQQPEGVCSSAAPCIEERIAGSLQ